ncbi:MAG TPA: histidine kinase, partial [Saprospiraceae bacterium]|nr:histidine kinase [Saprospiraceae bacterium]
AIRNQLSDLKSVALCGFIIYEREITHNQDNVISYSNELLSENKYLNDYYGLIAYLNLTMAYQVKSDYTKALKYAKKLRDSTKNPLEYGSNKRLAEMLYPTSLFLEAIQYEGLHKYPNALQNLLYLKRSIDPKDTSRHQLYKDVLSHLASVYHRLNKPDSAYFYERLRNTALITYYEALNKRNNELRKQLIDYEKRNLEILKSQQAQQLQLAKLSAHQKSNENVILVLVVLLLMLLLLGSGYYIKNRTIQFRRESGLLKKELELNEQTRKVASFRAAVSAQECERKRISMELHDGLGGMISLLQMNIQSLHPDSFAESLVNLTIQIEQCSRELRNIIENNSPIRFTEVALHTALQEYVDTISNYYKPKIIYQYGGEALHIHHFNDDFKLNVYRIVQELISNAIKHSDCNTIFIQFVLSYNQLLLNIEDNGMGFDSLQSIGNGLQNIHNRVDMLRGEVTISSQKFKGSSILVVIPISE